MNRRIALAATPLILLAACSSGGGSSEPSSSSSTTSATRSVASCHPTTPSTSTAKAAAAAKLSNGLKVTSVQETASSTDKSLRDVIVRVCGATTKGDDLKKQANAIAKSMKSAADAKTIASIRVTNVDAGDDPAGRVRCDDFQLNTFDGTAGTEIATWKTAAE